MTQLPRPGLRRRDLLAAAAAVPCTSRAATAGEVQLRVGWWGGGERHRRTLDALAAFEAANPGVRIKAEYMGFNGYLEKLTMQMVGGTEPDLMQINWAWLAMFSRDGRGFLDLHAHRSQIAFDQFTPDDIALCEVQGHLNGLPPSYSARLFLWNAAAYARAGLPLPTTWEQLFEAGPHFRRTLGERAYPLDGELYDMILLSLAWTHQSTGSGYLNPDEPRVALGDAALREWVRVFRRLADEHVATPLPYRASLGGAEKPTEQQPDWVRGLWAGNYTWDSQIRLRRSTLDADQRLALGESLRLPGARFNGALGRPAMLYAVSRRSRHPELAVRLLNYLLTDAAAARTLAVVRGLPSAKRALDVVLRERLAGDLETQAWQQVNAERAAGRIARPAPAFEDARMRKFLRDVFERVAYGRLTDAQAAEQLRVHGNALLMRIHGR